MPGSQEEKPEPQLNDGLTWEDCVQGAIKLLVDIDVFVDHLVGARFLAQSGNRTPPGHYNDRELCSVGSAFQDCDQLGAGHLGHLQVGHDDAGSYVPQHLQGGHSIRSRLDQKATLFEVAADRMANQHGIVDHERHAWHGVLLGKDSLPYTVWWRVKTRAS